MFSYYNNILVVEVQSLIDCKVLGYNNYKQLSARKQIHVLRRGCNATPALVEYESLPERFKAKVKEVIGCDPYQVVKVNRIAELIDSDSEASAFFDQFITAEGKYLPAEKRREYYANAIVLNAVRAFENQHKSQRAKIGGRKARVIDFAIEAISDLDRSRYPFNLPDNARAFERKYRDYCKNGYESLIHNAYKNGAKNAAKVFDEQQQGAMGVLLSDPRNLDNEQVARIYNRLAESMQWKQITGGAVAVWREKLDMETYARRKGAKAWMNSKTMQVKRRAPEMAMMYWVLDGWDIELRYKKESKKGGVNYNERATMVVVLDACCKYPIGYAIGVHESVSLIREALRSAHRHTEELFGQMMRVAQIQSDHYAMASMAPMYAVSAKHSTPASVGNAKSKVIEPWFRYFNKKYCQMQMNWTGFGVKAGGQPNMELLERKKSDFPDYEGMCAQVVSFLENERKELRDIYMSMAAKIPDEKLMPMPIEAYLLAYGEPSERKHMLTGSGISMSIGGKKYEYDCFDMDMRRHGSEHWRLLYDPADMTRALAVNEDESLQYVLEERYVQPMALAERKPGDAEALQRVIDYNKEMKEKVAKAIVGYETEVKKIEGQRALEWAQKFLIGDGKGQHKNKRNEARDKIVEAEMEEIEEKVPKKTKKAEMPTWIEVLNDY